MLTNLRPFLRFSKGLACLAMGFLLSCRDDLRIEVSGAAKSAAAISVYNTNLTPSSNLPVDDGEYNAALIDSSTKSFVIPEGKTGFMSLAAADGTNRTALADDTVKVYRRANAEYPIMTAQPGLVCDDIVFIDGDGLLSQGTKNCSGASACVSDGQKNCLATTQYPAALASGAAGKLLAGASLAGVSGTVMVPPACTSDGEVACVAIGPSFAAAVTVGAGSKIPVGYSLAGVAGAFAPDYPDVSHVLSTDTVNGSAGTLSLPAAANVAAVNGAFGVGGNGSAGLLNNCSVDGSSGCIAIPSYPAVNAGGLTAGNIKLSVVIGGVTGTYGGSGLAADCALDGELGCTTVTNFPAISKTAVGLAAKIKSAAVIAGVTGTFAPDCTVDGEIDCLAITTYKAAKMSNFTAANVQSGTTIAGVAGSLSLTNLSAAHIKAGVTINGTLGTYPSVSTPLAANTVAADLVSLGSATTVGAYEFFDSAGNAYATTVAAGGTVVPGTSNQTFSGASTVYNSFTVAGDANLTANKILSGTTLFTVSGSVTASPAACGSNGAQACVASGSYYAAEACGADGSNCYLPTYALTTQPLKAINYDTVDAAKMLTTQTISGKAGTIASQGSWNLTSTFPGAGYYTAVSNAPTASLRASASLNGVAGGISDCAADAANCFLPSYVLTTQPLKAINYDTVDTAKMLTTQTISGKVGTITNHGTWNLSSAFPGAGYYTAVSNAPTASLRSSATLNGTAGSISDCAADGTNCFLPAFVVTTQPLKAINYDTIDAAKMLTTQTISGKVGTIASQGSWNLTSTFPGAGYFTAVSNAPTASLLSSATINGSAGSISNCAADGTNCFLPTYVLTTQPLKAINYDTVDAAKMLTTQTISGKVGTIASQGSWNLTSAFPGAGYYTAVSNAPTASLRSSASINGTAGAISDCAADASNCFVPTYVTTTQPLKAISYDAIDAGKASIRTSLTLSGIAGTLATCSGANGTSCVTTATYPSMDISSATGGMLDLTASNFNASLAAAPSFEFWDSTGARHQMAGDTDLAAANIANSVVIHGATGTATLELHSNCTAANQTACVAVDPYRTMNLSAVGASSATGLTAANFETRLATAANSEFWDAAGARHLVAGDADLSVDKVKAGVAIHGVTGQYPSATYTLPSATATLADDLTSATFDAKAKSASAFEYWDSAGVYQTGTGDADIIATNIVSTATIFGLTGSVTSSVPPDPWNVRVGTVINGVTGQLKTNCRNRANAALIDSGVPLSATIATGNPDIFTAAAHGFAANATVRVGATTAPTGVSINDTTYYVRNPATNTFELSATSGGATLNITTAGTNVTVYKWADGTVNWWDTIDDYNNDLIFPTSLVAGWTSDTDCNYSNWQDLTADGICDAAADNCIMKDRISNLMWSETYPVNATAPASTAVNWQKAVQHCNNLSFAGYTDWRLPTQKEVKEAYIHGLRDVGYNGTGTIRGSASTHNNNQFILNVDASFWTGSMGSYSGTEVAYIQDGFIGSGNFQGKYESFPLLCVR